MNRIKRLWDQDPLDLLLCGILYVCVAALIVIPILHLLGVVEVGK